MHQLRFQLGQLAAGGVGEKEQSWQGRGACCHGSGHGRGTVCWHLRALGMVGGLLRGKRGVMKPYPCPQGSTRKKVSRDRLGDTGSRAELWALPDPRGHPSPGCLYQPRFPPVPQAGPWGLSSVPSSLAEDPACCCCFCLQGAARL